MSANGKKKRHQTTAVLAQVSDPRDARLQRLKAGKGYRQRTRKGSNLLHSPPCSCCTHRHAAIALTAMQPPFLSAWFVPRGAGSSQSGIDRIAESLQERGPWTCRADPARALPHLPIQPDSRRSEVASVVAVPACESKGKRGKIDQCICQQQRRSHTVTRPYVSGSVANVLLIDSFTLGEPITAAIRAWSIAARCVSGD